MLVSSIDACEIHNPAFKNNIYLTVNYIPDFFWTDFFSTNLKTFGLNSFTAEAAEGEQRHPLFSCQFFFLSSHSG